MSNPNTNVVVNNAYAYNGRGAFVVEIIGATAPTIYEIRTTSYTGTIIGTQTFGGNSTYEGEPYLINCYYSYPNSTTTTLYVTAYVATADGGTGTRSNVTTFSLVSSAFSGTAYTYTVSTSGKFPNVQTVLTPGGTYSYPLNLSSGDCIIFTYSAGTIAPQITKDIYGFTIYYNAAYPNTTALYYDVKNMTTNGQTAYLPVLASGANITNNLINYKINGDSTANATPALSREGTAATELVDTFTVSGLATGKECRFVISGDSDIQVKINSGPYFGGSSSAITRVSIPRIKNSDTLTIKSTSPQVADVSKLIQIQSYDGREQPALTESYFSLTTARTADIAFGMEVFDDLGIKTLSVNDRTTRWVAYGSVSHGIIAGSSTEIIDIPIPGLRNTPEWIVTIVEKYVLLLTPTVTKVNDILRLTFVNPSTSARAAAEFPTEYFVGVTG
jgi:hypothetical protein